MLNFLSCLLKFISATVSCSTMQPLSDWALAQQVSRLGLNPALSYCFFSSRNMNRASVSSLEKKSLPRHRSENTAHQCYLGKTSNLSVQPNEKTIKSFPVDYQLVMGYLLRSLLVHLSVNASQSGILLSHNFITENHLSQGLSEKKHYRVGFEPTATRN